jgi:hypothetical protein
MPQVPNINIFMMTPSDGMGKRESTLSKALKSKKEDKKHEETISKLSSMIRELRTLPRQEPYAGGV